MRYRSLLAGAAALALVLSLAACGADDGGDDASSTTTTEKATETTEAPDETTESTEAEDETTTAPEEEGGDDLSAALVTPEDVGPGFVEADYETSDEPGPCGGDVDAEHPYDAIVGTVVGQEETQLALQHELRTYADDETATETFTAAQDAFSCGADTAIEGLALSEVADVSADVGADAFAVEVTSATDGTEGALVAVLVGNVLSVYQFQGPAGGEEGPDPLAIITANIEVVKEAVGA